MSFYRTPITIAAETVSSALSGFPVYVDLSDMPAGFWTQLYYSDGRDIRVKAEDGEALPFDLVFIAPESLSGSLFVKTNVSDSADTVIFIHYGDPSLSAVAPSAPNGRNAVWAEYHRVYLFGGDSIDRTGNGGRPAQSGKSYAFENVATSANLGVHQGVCFDGTYYYVTDTNAIKKYDAEFSLVSTNADPVGDVGGGVNHCGDPDVHDGIIYIPIENYVSISDFSFQRIARFNASNLAFIDSVSISAQGHECSSVCFCEADGLLYVASYADGSKLWKYNASTLEYVGSLTLGASISKIQGVTFWRGAFFINSDTLDETIRVEYDGTVSGMVFGESSGVYEGLGHSDGALLLLHDTTGSADGVVRRLEPRDVAAKTGVRFLSTTDFTGDIKCTGLSRFTQWSIGVSVKLASKGGNRCAVSYGQAGSALNTNRTSIAYRSTSDCFGFWNSTDGWILDPVPAEIDTIYRYVATQNGTTGRALYRDGSSVVTGSASAEQPATGADCLYLGVEDGDKTEQMDGELGFVYLRSGVLSGDWIAAEAANLSAPSSFYSVGAVEDVITEFPDWLKSTSALRCVLVEVDAFVSGIETTFYLSTRGYTTGTIDTPADTNYLPVIAGGVQLTEELSLEGAGGLSYGDIEIYNLSGERDGWLDYIWVNRPIRVYLGDLRRAREDYQLIFDGIVDDLDSKSRDRLNIKIRDKLQRLNTPVSDAKLGGATANADLLIPIALGEVSNVTPLLTDPTLHEYQWHNGPAESAIEVRDNGVPVSATHSLSTGKFTLSASPAGTITFSGQGDKPSAYSNTISSLVQRIATGYGKAATRFDAGDLDAGNLAAFDAANPQPVGVYLSSRENCINVIQQLATSVGAQAVMSRSGKLRLLQIALPPAGTPTAITAADMVENSLHIARRIDVKASVKLGYNKNWTIQTDLQTGIPEAHKDLFANEWLTVTELDAAVAAVYKLDAEPVQRDTLLLATTDAEAEAQRELDLYSVPRTVYGFEGFSQLLALELGSPVTLIHPRFGLAAGKTGMVTKLSPDWINARVNVEVLI
jgi:hypothetical protein